ncbi:MAG: hypothetical protein QXH80_00570, partial [Candidatus Nanoarchaeia archaeon]
PNSRYDFINLQNSITARNAWLDSYWFDLNWQNRSTILISGTLPNAQVNPQITAGYDCFNEVRVTDSNNNEIPSNVTAMNAPCDVVFPASAGTYYVYWNNPFATAPPYRALGLGVPTGSLIRTEGAPTNMLCPHLIDAYKNIADISCSVQNIYSSNQINYSVSFHSTDFSFDGFLS